MPARFTPSMVVAVVIGALAGAALTLAVTRKADQPAAGRPKIDGKPNLSGIWQAHSTPNWDLEAHEARAGAVMQPGVYPYEYAQVPAAPIVALGAAGGVPASVGVVQDDGKIPYKTEALAIKKANAEHWIDRDPELKCYLPGIPRATYMPFPFKITQSTNKVQMAYEFANAARTIHLDKVEDSQTGDLWMGDSRGRWDGDTLVVDVKDFNGKAWFDRAGNFASSSLHVTERFSLLTPDVIKYDVTIEDPNTFTRPWRISMPLYRRMEPNAQLLEYRCTEFVEEFMLGGLRKRQLVKHWEGETMAVDITRKIPAGDKFYDWYGK
jgi:hypothetical protein